MDLEEYFPYPLCFMCSKRTWKKDEMCRECEREDKESRERYRREYR